MTDKNRSTQRLANEIEIPASMIQVENGKLHPLAKFSISCHLEDGMLTPALLIDMPSSEDHVPLEMSQLAPETLPCKLDFATEVLPIVIHDDKECWGLFTLVFSKNIKIIRFFLKWLKDADGFFAVGKCEIVLESGAVVDCNVDKKYGPSGERVSKRLSTVFTELPWVS